MLDIRASVHTSFDIRVGKRSMREIELIKSDLDRTSVRIRTKSS